MICRAFNTTLSRPPFQYILDLCQVRLKVWGGQGGRGHTDASMGPDYFRTGRWQPFPKYFGPAGNGLKIHTISYIFEETQKLYGT